MIEYKFIVGGWKEITKEQAKQVVKNQMAGITTMKDEDKIKYIEEKKIRGIKVKELLKEEN